jgi:acetylxylan esterase
VQNSYYSQCIPGTAAPTTTSRPTTSTPASTVTGSAPTGLSSIPASTLHQITNFGTNPNNVGMYVYKPAKVASKPALIVASHCMCFHVAFQSYCLLYSPATLV